MTDGGKVDEPYTQKKDTKYGKAGRMSDLLVCTTSWNQTPNKCKQAVEMLEESCGFYGLDFGMWGSGGGYNNNVGYKVRGMIDFLNTVSHPYVFFSDGWDSWMLAGEKDILDTYHTFEKPIVLCGHQFLYPERRIKEFGVLPSDFPEAPTRFRWICAGGFMGEREALKKALTIVEATGIQGTDQGAWNIAFGKKQITSIAEIDYHCKLFLTMSEISQEQLYFDKEKKVVFKETESRPMAIHFGGAKGGAPNDVNMKSFYEVWKKNR